MMDQRLHYPELYSLLNWFMAKTMNEYLDSNLQTILKSIKNDKPPQIVKDALYEFELNNKKRPEVLNELKNDNNK